MNFGSGISDEQIWLTQNGNNLEVQLLDSNGEATIDGWFGGSSGGPPQSFQANGLTLNTSFSQLISAMATYSTNNPGFNPATATQMPNDSTLQSAISSSWHH